MKISLNTLNSALLLGASEPGNVPVVWHGTVPDEHGVNSVVIQVPASHATQAAGIIEACLAQEIKPVAGSSWVLFPVPIKHLKLDLPVKVRQWNGTQDDSEHTQWKSQVVARMDALGISRIEMEYSGAGDSANDDSWEASRTGIGRWYPALHDDRRAAHFYEMQNYKLPDDLTTLISDYVWETLVEHDCVNNEGGGGSMVIDLSNDEPVFLFSCHTYTTVTHEHNVEEPI